MTISAQKVIPTTKRTSTHISPAPPLTRSPYGSSIGRLDSRSIEATSIDEAVGESILLSSVLASISVRLLVASLPPSCPRPRYGPDQFDRVSLSRSWLSKAERGGFAHPAAQAAVLASPSGSARTARCSTVQRDCLADARALAGSESPRPCWELPSGFFRETIRRGGDSNPRYHLRGTTVFETAALNQLCHLSG
jgi:hypothetical protein